VQIAVHCRLRLRLRLWLWATVEVHAEQPELPRRCCRRAAALGVRLACNHPREICSKNHPREMGRDPGSWCFKPFNFQLALGRCKTASQSRLPSQFPITPCLFCSSLHIQFGRGGLTRRDRWIDRLCWPACL